MDSKRIDDIKKLPPQEAITILTGILEDSPDDSEALTLRGECHWALNHRRDAINDYLASIRIKPDGRAKLLLEYANSILDFYHKDLLNP